MDLRGGAVAPNLLSFLFPCQIAPPTCKTSLSGTDTSVKAIRGIELGCGKMRNHDYRSRPRIQGLCAVAFATMLVSASAGSMNIHPPMGNLERNQQRHGHRVHADCRRAALHLCGGDAKTERNHAGQGAALCDKCGTDCAARISSVTEHMEAEHMERPEWRGGDECEDTSETATIETPHKHIFLVSDRTGLTVSRIFGEALNQFGIAGEEAVVQVFSHVRSVAKMSRIVALAESMQAVVLSTMLDGTLRAELQAHCDSANVNAMDLLGSAMDGLASYLGATPLSLYKNGEYRAQLPQDYFKKIDSVDFAINQDDSRNPRNYCKADVVLVAVKGMQKQLAAIYMAQTYGLKVANVKLAMGRPLDAELAEVEPHRIFALTCPPEYLHNVRCRRAESRRVDHMRKGVVDEKPAENDPLTDLEYVKKELAWCQELYREHPTWTVVDVTDMSVEEVAEVCIRPSLGLKTDHAVDSEEERWPEPA